MTKLLLSSSFLTLLVMGANFGLKIILSHLYPKETLGIFYTLFDLIGLGAMLFSGFKDSLIVAFDHFRREKILYIYTVIFWSAVVPVLVGESLYFFRFGFQFSFPLFLLLLGTNLGMLFFSYINSSLKRYRVMLFEMPVFTLSLMITFALFYPFVRGISALLYAYLFGYLARAIYLLYHIRHDLHMERCSLGEYGSFYKNSVLSSMMYFFSSLFVSMAGVLLWKLYHDQNLLGEYQVVVRSIFFSLVAIFVFPLNSLVFPKISQIVSEKKFEQMRQIEKRFLKYVGLFAIAIVALMPLTQPLICLLFPPVYRESYLYLEMMLPFLPFIAYTTFALNIIKAFDRFDLALYVRIAGSGVFFLAILLFVLLHQRASMLFVAFDLAFVSMALLSGFYKRRLLG